MRYNLSAEAVLDLRHIYRYTLKSFGETQADRYVSRLQDTFEMLCGEPKAGKIAGFNSLPQIRKMLSDKHFIYYEIGSDFIGISRIIHSSEDVNDNKMRPFQ